MKQIKSGTVLLIAVLVLFAFCLGMYLGRQSGSGEVLLCTEKDFSPSEVCCTEADSLPAGQDSGLSEMPESAVPSGPVNINTATKEQLMTLPGIGDVLSQRILDYRAAHGRFQSVEELTEVSGIGAKKMEEILEYVTVEE